MPQALVIDFEVESDFLGCIEDNCSSSSFWSSAVGDRENAQENQSAPIGFSRLKNKIQAL